MSEFTFPWKTGMKYVMGGDFIPSDMNVPTAANLYRAADSQIVDVKADTSACTSMSYMFSNSKVVYVEPFDTSACTNMQYMFNECSDLITIPEMDTSNVTAMNYFLYYCQNYLFELPMLDTSKVTNMNNLLRQAKISEFPQWDMSNVTDVGSMFQACPYLHTIPELNWGSVSACNYPFGTSNMTSVCNLGGFKDLGKSKSLSGTSSYFLNVLTDLTPESLRNVINGLYDRKTAGYSTISLKFGSTNLAKLTDEEKAICTNKGWTLTT